jgi:hypothetical protein
MSPRNIVILGCLSTVLVATTCLPASAVADVSHSLYNSKGVRVGYGGVTNDRTRVYSCDTLGDGHGFRTTYYLKNGTNSYIDDANGSSSGCSARFAGSSSNPIICYEVRLKGTDNQSATLRTGSENCLP